MLSILGIGGNFSRRISLAIIVFLILSYLPITVIYLPDFKLWKCEFTIGQC